MIVHLWSSLPLLPWVLVVLEAVIVLAAVGQVWVRRARQQRWQVGARLVTILAPPQPDPDGAAALWGNLAGLLRPRWRRLLCGQPHLCFEYRLAVQASTIRMWVPGPVPPGLVERAIAAAWPGATTHTTPAPPPQPSALSTALSAALFAGAGRGRARRVSTGGVLRLARRSGLPLAEHVPGDPIAALLATAADLTATERTATGVTGADLAERPTAVPDDAAHPSSSPGGTGGEDVVVQVLARPTPTRSAPPGGHHHDGTGTFGALGAGLVNGLVGTLVWALRECLAILAPTASSATAAHGGYAGRRSEADPRARLERSGGDRAAVAKARHASFDTLIRYAATTTLVTDPNADPAQAQAEQSTARRRVRGRAHAVAAVFASYTGHNHYRRHRLHRPARAVAARRLGRGDRLSVDELAAIATLPAGDAPGLARAGARNVAPSPAIARPGPQVKPLGDTTTAHGAGGAGRPVGVRVPDARHHLHVIGATGSGKSTLLSQLILDDIHHGRGVVVIDPKGDLITDITARLPRRLLGEAVLIDPDRPAAAPNLNPLATAIAPGSAGPGAESENGRALAVENLVTICRRVFTGYWGPRTDDLMRAVCLTLIAQPTPRTLADLPALLTNPDVRARALRAIAGDSVLRGFWTSYNRLSEPARAVIIAPLMNRIRALLLRPYARTLLTGRPTAGTPGLPKAGIEPAVPVDVGRVLDGGILLARIPKGSLGEEATRIVGSIIVAHTWTAATARTRIPQQARRDAALVIDECHNFLNLPYSIDDLLAEARGLRLSLTLAHQNLAQLPPELRAGITANARNKLIFTVGADDARDLARHTQPHLDDYDLGHLDAFHAAARLLDHAALTPAFTLRTRPLPPPQPQR